MVEVPHLSRVLMDKTLKETMEIMSHNNSEIGLRYGLTEQSDHLRC